MPCSNLTDDLRRVWATLPDSLLGARTKRSRRLRGFWTRILDCLANRWGQHGASRRGRSGRAILPAPLEQPILCHLQPPDWSNTPCTHTHTAYRWRHACSNEVAWDKSNPNVAMNFSVGLENRRLSHSKLVDTPKNYVGRNGRSRILDSGRPCAKGLACAFRNESKCHQSAPHLLRCQGASRR